MISESDIENCEENNGDATFPVVDYYYLYRCELLLIGMTDSGLTLKIVTLSKPRQSVFKGFKNAIISLKRQTLFVRIPFSSG